MGSVIEVDEHAAIAVQDSSEDLIAEMDRGATSDGEGGRKVHLQHEGVPVVVLIGVPKGEGTKIVEVESGIGVTAQVKESTDGVVVEVRVAVSKIKDAGGWQERAAIKAAESRSREVDLICAGNSGDSDDEADNGKGGFLR